MKVVTDKYEALEFVAENLHELVEMKRDILTEDMASGLIEDGPDIVDASVDIINYTKALEVLSEFPCVSIYANKPEEK